jgi:hypothetical protein
MGYAACQRCPPASGPCVKNVSNVQLVDGRIRSVGALFGGELDDREDGVTA